MYIIVGLGNPGLKYQNTKHNVGFMAIDILSKKLNIKVDKIKFKALIGEGQYKGEKIILVKPQTFMNLSGESVQQIMSFYKAEHQNLFVLYDDIDIDIGKLRIRQKGSSGTHNGMKNIIYLLGYDDFPRFRIGVSRPPQYMDLASYVLSNFTKEEIDILLNVLDNCSEACLYAIEKGLDKSMNKYNIK
ncbi:aminoacyl-tRNA hydrolase [Peptoanaerobacter stomatis]|jgi:aminoacyl-tRNA hydrolase|uniref:Peptidyl-tRNA hydrolase n=1 Tax=Peptoanaerobacter stomatis TaxID=796937 RepID=G9WY48_9FIRM|nr:aminoacyl-tRNA hydrolase [Peptoanaerobacter stomatis]EHL16552.1 peptidyl-tRNA hydrolase [Peptoanaerobacter stomatis]